MMIEQHGILAAIPGATRARIESLHCFETIDSTSDWLNRQALPPPGRCRIAIAAEQTAGRGRRDNGWASPKDAGLWLSLSYAFEEAPPQLAGLTLVIGAGIAESLRGLGADVMLKWPNDLVAHDAKLGGILTEVGDRGRGAVIGVGLNVDLPDGLAGEIGNDRGTPVTDLRACCGELPSRTALAVIVIRALVDGISRFAQEGLAAELATWRRYDWLAGKRIAVEDGDRRITGTAAGVDHDGALRVQTDVGVRRIVSGSVSLQGPADACR